MHLMPCCDIHRYPRFVGPTRVFVTIHTLVQLELQRIKVCAGPVVGKGTSSSKCLSAKVVGGPFGWREKRMSCVKVLAVPGIDILSVELGQRESTTE
jgi:hypothetical protein